MTIWRMVAALAFLFLFAHESSAQKSMPRVRIGIEAPAGTNSHYYVTKQLGLFQKHGVNIELISFPGGTVGLQALLAGDIQFASSDGVAGLSANLRGANLYFVAGMINNFLLVFYPGRRFARRPICAARKSSSAATVHPPTRRCGWRWKNTNSSRTRTWSSFRAAGRPNASPRCAPPRGPPPS